MMINKFIIVSFCSLLAIGTSAQKKRISKGNAKTVVAGTPAEPSEELRMLLDSYCFEEAHEQIESEIAAAQKKKQTTEQIEALLPYTIIGENMLQATEKVIIVDSFVVDKKNFLQAYYIAPNCGTIEYFTKTFPNIKNISDQVKNSTVYTNELGDQMFFSNYYDRGVRLFSSNKIGSGWTSPAPLNELGDSTDVIAYPYMMSDGTTLYFAAQDANSLGGYDIYVTRFNTDTKKFLKPENLGMPYNSPANDYLYVIDEENNLGWFASDRYQPGNKVCIYVFIPTESRETYDIDDDNEELVRSLAKIESIKNSQTNKKIVAEARQRISQAMNRQNSQAEQKEFKFYVVSGLIYTSTNDFKSEKARQLIQTWATNYAQREALLKELERWRHLYAQKADTKIKETIVMQEKRLEQLDIAVQTIANNIRKEEQAVLK